MRKGRSSISVKHGGGILLSFLGVLLALACNRSHELAMVPRVTDLLRLVDDQRSHLGKNFKVGTWLLDGDSRAVFFQHPPSRVVLGPIPAGESCVLRFGMGLGKNSQARSDGVDFRLSIQRGEDEQLFFREFLDPRLEGNRGWVDREVAIPTTAEGSFSVVLETAPGPTKVADHSGWGAPHVVCDAPSDLPNSSQRPNVILISIDTLRSDHLGFYGYSRPTSPALDALARESLIFDNAFTPAPHTLPSHASMFTGLFPYEHGAGHRFPEARLGEDARTIAEILRDAGYRTVGFSAGGMMSGRNGLSQGFDEWTERQPANLRSGMPAVFDALHRAGAQPIFLFLHTYDVHGPYEQPVSARFFQAAEAATQVSMKDWARILRVPYHKYQKFGRFSSLPGIYASYDSGIRFVDTQLASLFKYLRETGAMENTLLIVTSDHGESMFEHGRYIGHSFTLSDGEVRVPLLVKLPNSRETGRRDDLVQLVDLFPMMMDEAGVERRAKVAGRNPLVEHELPGAQSRWVHGEASHTGARYIRTERWKIISATADAWEGRKRIFARDAERFETGWQIFDLSKDSMESNNLFGDARDYPDEVREMIRTIRSLEVPGQGMGRKSDTPRGEDADALRALGYIQ